MVRLSHSIWQLWHWVTARLTRMKQACIWKLPNIELSIQLHCMYSHRFCPWCCYGNTRMFFADYKGLVAIERWKQLSSFRSLSLEGGSAILRRDAASIDFPKCCSQCFKMFNKICTGSRRIVSANFLCPIAISDSQKPLKLRDARPDSQAGWRRLMLMNIMSNAARVKPKSVRWHRLTITR